jgi:hypothetical protein
MRSRQRIPLRKERAAKAESTPPQLRQQEKAAAEYKIAWRLWCPDVS